MPNDVPFEVMFPLTGNINRFELDHYGPEQEVTFNIEYTSSVLSFIET